MSTIEPPRAVAGFWARLGAFIIDTIILGGIGFLVALPMRDWLVKATGWGHLVGFAIALAYFSWFDSRLAGGQTLGKKVLRIQVVDASGAHLSPARAAVRFLPLAAVWFLNGLRLPGAVESQVLAVVLSICVFGLGASMAYLCVFNRRTRQSVHDLLVGSYVVRAPAAGSLPPAGLWRVHAAACGILLVASAIVPFAVRGLGATEPFSSLLLAYRAVTSQPGVMDARVTRGTIVATQSPRRNYLSFVAYSSDAGIDDPARARQLANAGLAAMGRPDPAIDFVSVTMVYGYDIGIWSSWTSHVFNYTPAELSGRTATL